MSSMFNELYYMELRISRPTLLAVFIIAKEVVKEINIRNIHKHV